MGIPLLVMKGFVKFSLLLPFLLVRLDVFGQQCSTARFNGENYEVSRNKVNNKEHCLNELRFQRLSDGKKIGKKMCLAKTPTKETKKICCCDQDSGNGSDDCPCSLGISTSTTTTTTTTARPGPTKPSCPSRILLSNCNINCHNDNDKKCGRFGVTIHNQNSIQTWTMFEGSEKDSCSLKCQSEKVTSTCDLIDGKMQWSLPKKIKEECGIPTTETCPSKTIFEKCNIQCRPEDHMVTSVNNGGTWETTWKVPVGVENSIFMLTCDKEIFKSGLTIVTATCNEIDGKLDWSIKNKEEKDKLVKMCKINI